MMSERGNSHDMCDRLLKKSKLFVANNRLNLLYLPLFVISLNKICLIICF